MLQRPDDRDDEKRQRKRLKHRACLCEGSGNQHRRHEPDGDLQCSVGWQGAWLIQEEILISAWVFPSGAQLERERQSQCGFASLRGPVKNVAPTVACCISSLFVIMSWLQALPREPLFFSA